MANAASYVAEIGVDLDKLSAGIKEAQSKLAKLGDGVQPKGLDSFVDRARKSLSSFGDAATKVGTQISIGFALPLTVLAKKIFDTGKEYEQAMNVFQVATKATGAEMARAAALAEALGNDIRLPGVSAADAAIAMTELGKAGFDVNQSMSGVRGVLELSTAATIGAADAAKLTTAALQAFGLAASESGRVADLLAAAATATSAEITDVGMALQQSAASAAALKIPVDDLVTSISLMATAGIKGSDAGTSLKTFMNALTPSTKAAAAAMQELGIHAFDSAGRFVGLEAIINQAAPALARMTDQQRANAIETAFGSDAQRAANIVLGAGVEKFREMDVVVNKAGAAQEMAAAKSKGLSGAMEAFISTLETVAIKIYKDVGPGLEGMVRKFGDVIGSLSSLSPVIVKAGASFAGTFALGGVAALAVGKFITMLTELSPQGRVIAGVLLGVSAIAAAYKTNFGQMQGVVESFMRTMRGLPTETKSAVSSMTSFWDGLSMRLVNLVGVIDLVQTAFAHLVNAVKTALNLLGSFITGNWFDTGRFVQEGLAEAEKIQEDYSKRYEMRQMERRAIERGGWQAHFKLLENIASDGGKNIGEALTGEFRTVVLKENPANAVRDALISGKGPTIEAARRLGSESAAVTASSYKSKWISEMYHSPFYIIHELMTALSGSLIVAEGFSKVGFTAGESMKKGAKGKGKAMAKALLDEFDNGLKGFEDALKTVLAKALSVDVKSAISKSAKKGAEEYVEALKTLAPAVNDFLQAQGIAAKVTESELDAMVKSGKTSLLTYTHAWEKAEEATRQAGIEMAKALPAPLKDINALLKENGFDIELSAKLWEKLSPAQKSAAVSLGEVAKAAKITNIEIDAQKSHFDKAVDVITNFSTRVGLAFDELKTGKITASQFASVLRGDVAPAIELVKENADGLSASLTSLAERAERSLKKFKDAFENNFKLQDLNLKSNIFGSITSQLDQLAQISGVDKDIVLQNFRDMLAGSVAAAGAGAAELQKQIALIDQAILNSQLAKLEDTWGKPLGRAIEAILVHYNKLNVATGKLQTSVLAKVTALGELFAVLPGSIGQSINKVINIINSVVSVVTKALNVLVAFGVNLPGPIGKVLDILNKGAGSTTAVMKQMAEDVKLIMQDMAQQVIAIFKQMADEAKKQIDSMKQGAQNGAQGIASSFVGGLSSLPGSVGGILNQVGGLFGGLGSKIVAAIGQIITASRGLNQVPTIFNSTANLIAGSVNSIIGSLQNLALNSQNSLGAFQLSASQMQTGIGGMFKDLGSVILHAAGGAAQQANQAGQAIHQSLLGGILGIAAGGFLGGVGIGRATQSKLIGGIGGGLTGAASGALAGMMIGAAGGPIGALGGAIIGGIAGIVGGIFGGMKSAFVKAMEKEQLAQAQFQTKTMAESLKQMTQSTLQAVIKTGSDLADLMNKVGDTVFVPKEVINKFLKQGFSFLKKLADGLKDLAAKATPEMKAAAENFQPVIQLAASLPAAFDAINGHWGIAENQFVIFFKDYDRLIDGFLSRAETAVKKQFKKAGKLAELITPAVSLLAPLIEGITGINDLKEPTDAQFGIIDRSIDAIVTHLGALGQKFEKYYLKTLRFFAEQAQAGLAVWKDATDAIRATVDVPVPKESDVVNVVDGIRLFVEKLIAGVADLTTEGLSRAVEIANSVSPIASAFKTWAESADVISKYSKIASETWDAIVFDFNRGLSLLDLLLNSAIDYVAKATAFDDKVIAGNLKLEHGLSAYADGILNASSILNGTIGQLGGGVQSGDNFGANSIAPSSFTPSFAGPSFASSSQPMSSSKTVSYHYHFGNMTISGTSDNPKIQRLEKAVKALIGEFDGFVNQEVQYG